MNAAKSADGRDDSPSSLPVNLPDDDATVLDEFDLLGACNSFPAGATVLDASFEDWEHVHEGSTDLRIPVEPFPPQPPFQDVGTKKVALWTTAQQGLNQSKQVLSK